MPPLGKPCDFPICFWQAQFGSSQIEITVTNCGSFYVYFLQPTLTEDLKTVEPLSSASNRQSPGPLSPVYCTTEKDIHKGNSYETTFSPSESLFLVSSCYFAHKTI